MGLFNYRARTREGQAIKGVIEGPTIEAAAETLRDKQLIVTVLKEKSTADWFKQFEQLWHRVTPREITFFARQFAVLIGATIPVVRSLRILTRQTKNDYFKRVISDVAAAVDGGLKLSQAMGKYPKVFDPFFVHMIRAGETTGRLDQVFDYLADQKEKDYTLVSRVRGAMIYPSFIVAVMIGVGVLMMVYVIPPIRGILIDSGASIPITTQILLFVSQFLQKFWWLVVLCLIVAAVGGWFYSQTANGRFALDTLKIRLPAIGAIYQRIVMGRFAISLSNLLASGVPLPTALRIVADIVNNAVYHDLLLKTVKEVETGNTISSAFLKSNRIPPMVAQMISIGEETGKLDEILMKLGQFYAQEVDTSLSTLTSLIEPIVIISLGIAAFIMVSGILTPIYNATTSIA